MLLLAFRTAPGLCGHFALADLWRHVRGITPPSPDAALSLAATFAAAFHLDLQTDKLVRPPLLAPFLWWRGKRFGLHGLSFFVA